MDTQKDNIMNICTPLHQLAEVTAEQPPAPQGQLPVLRLRQLYQQTLNEEQAAANLLLDTAAKARAQREIAPIKSHTELVHYHMQQLLQQIQPSKTLENSDFSLRLQQEQLENYHIFQLSQQRAPGFSS